MLKDPPGPVNNGHKNCRIPEKMVSLPDFWLPSRPQLHVWKRLVSPWQGPTDLFFDWYAAVRRAQVSKPQHRPEAVQWQIKLNA